ncbi:hypothetical protein ABTM89_19395, partial [Acinetobacter baumannii]
QIDLSNCNIGFTGTAGTQALIQAFLTRRATLQNINLHNNFIGSKGTTDFQVFAENIQQFEALQFLDISGNNIPVNTVAGRALMIQFAQN